MRYVIPSLLLFTAAVPAFATIDGGLLALAPSGAKTISGVDVNRAKSSPFGQFILSKMNSDDQGFQQMTQETGFDPRRDVQDVLFVSNGPGADESKPAFGILVRGNFDVSRIRKTVLEKGATVKSYQGVDIMVEASGHDRNAFAFLDVDIAVMGDIGSVQQMIANRANPAALDPALQQLVSAAGANHDAWFASLGAGPYLSHGFKREAGQGVNPEALQSIVLSSGGVLLGDTVQLSFDAVARSAKDATSLVDVVRFGASMIQMQRNAGAEALAASLDNMTVKSDGSNVHVALSIPETSLEQLADMKSQHRVGGTVKPTSPSQQ